MSITRLVVQIEHPEHMQDSTVMALMSHGAQFVASLPEYPAPGVLTYYVEIVSSSTYVDDPTNDTVTDRVETIRRLVP